MPRSQKPFVVSKRLDSKTYFFTINKTSGLPEKVCKQWKRKSFQAMPPELSRFSNPKSKSAGEAGVMALINLLKGDNSKAIRKDSVTVGAWLRLFTSVDTSPKAARLVNKNRPYSDGSVDRLKGLYDVHMKDDPFMCVLMSEAESQDALAFINRMSQRELEGRYKNWKVKPKMIGTESFIKLIKFVRMAFKEYSRERPYWQNPFRDIEPPKDIEYPDRDSLIEEEVVSLFKPGVLLEKMEVAICAAMFWAGLRRGEIFALRPEDLDWGTPRINVRQGWQNYALKRRKLGSTKSKRDRVAPFDDILQEAIKALWLEYGKHQYVFAFADGKTPGPSWISGRLKKWIARAKINLGGRNIVPHSCRNSLAQTLEDHGVSLRHIQELLGHLSLRTTKRHYLQSTSKKIREINKSINEAMEALQEEEPKSNIIPLSKVS
jgi:integrase